MLPAPRGEISARLLKALSAPPAPIGDPGPLRVAEPLGDEDLQLALYLCYELHYGGLAGVSDEWEWDPSLLGFRARLERAFTDALLEAVPGQSDPTGVGELDLELRAIAEAADGPSLSRFIRARATLEQVREFVVHRSAYQLKEADPHSWAIPRISGPAKAALLEVQYDEYGGGRADWMHAALFARAMRALLLNDTPGGYLELIPGVTLATVNLMSLFGLHRRWRGAIIGHLALFEMTSSIPNRRYADGLRRLGLGEEATLFFDEHVVADAVHENLAAVDLAGGLVRQEPALRASVLWGARTLVELERRWCEQLVGAWRDGGTSLLAPLDADAPASAAGLVPA